MILDRDKGKKVPAKCTIRFRVVLIVISYGFLCLDNLKFPIDKVYQTKR